MIENLKKILYSNTLIALKDGKLSHINVTQNPTKLSQIDKIAFESIENVQLIFNKLLYYTMISEHEDIDDPIYKDVLNKIRRIKPTKRINSLFIRSDYLLEEIKESENIRICPKQVEINTISCAFLMMEPILNKVHRLFDPHTIVSNSDLSFVRFAKEIKFLSEDINKEFTLKDFWNKEEKITCKNYENKNKPNFDNPICVMIDNDTTLNSSNIFEKMAIIKSFKENEIDIFHLTSEDLKKGCKFIKRSDGELLTDDEVEIYLNSNLTKKIEIVDMFYEDRYVFFVYYRWFYNFSQYKQKDIVLRAKIECSTAVSLPSVELQIMGLKIFQIRFKSRDYLKKYLSDIEIDQILKYFGEFYEYTKGMTLPMDSTNLVLKSLEEGGGNNLYDKDIEEFKGDPKKVFLMKKINGKIFRNNFISDLEDGEKRNIIPEIGIMGWLIAKDNDVIYNENAGYICRSKDVKSNECGVSCGFGALDSLSFKK